MLCNVTIKGRGSISNNVWEKLDATTLLKVQTGEALPNFSAHYKGLRISQNINGFTIKNSLHKFSQTHNTGLFTLANCIQAINDLCGLLEVDLWQYNMPKFEFGINIPVLQNPSIYLQQIQGFKSKSLYPFDIADRQQTLFFETADYKIKIYNKTLEAKFKHNLLRLEIERISPAHYLPKMKTVAEIVNQNSFKILANELLKKFNQIQFHEPIQTTVKCSNFFLMHYFCTTAMPKSKKQVQLLYNTKQANYYQNKYLKLLKESTSKNLYKQEIEEQLNTQLSLILGSIPNL